MCVNITHGESKMTLSVDLDLVATAEDANSQDTKSYSVIPTTAEAIRERARTSECTHLFIEGYVWNALKKIASSSTAFLLKLLLFLKEMRNNRW